MRLWVACLLLALVLAGVSGCASAPPAADAYRSPRHVAPAAGALMLKDYGGIALPYENVLGGKEIQVRLRDNPFAEPDELREGLGLVLAALLGSRTTTESIRPLTTEPLR